MKTSVVIAQLLAFILVCACGQSSAVAQHTHQKSPSPLPAPTLSAGDLAQLSDLEKRPLRLPAMQANGQCVADGPHALINPYRDSTDVADSWGAGPVYVEGGPETDTFGYAYFDVTFFTSPAVTNVVLIRGQELGGPYKVVFTGSWAVGPVVGSDTIQGAATQLRGDLALPADQRSNTPDAAQGWSIWRVRQGIDARDRGCIGFQIDLTNGTEIFVVADR